MKTVLVGLLLITLALNSYAKDPSVTVSEAELKNLAACESIEKDSKGIFTRTFFYTANSKMGVDILSIVNTRQVVDPKTSTKKIAHETIVPPQRDFTKIRFAGKLNADKSTILSTGFKLCMAKSMVTQLAAIAGKQQQDLNQVPGLINLAAEGGYHLGLAHGLSADAYKAMILGQKIGHDQGLIDGYEFGYGDGAEDGEKVGIVKGIVGTLQLLNQQGIQQQKKYEPRSSASFTSSDGALTRKPVTDSGENAVLAHK